MALPRYRRPPSPSVVVNACTDGRSLESSAPLQKRSSEANKCAGGLDAAGGGVRGLVGDACGAGCQCQTTVSP